MSLVDGVVDEIAWESMRLVAALARLAAMVAAAAWGLRWAVGEFGHALTWPQTFISVGAYVLIRYSLRGAQA